MAHSSRAEVGVRCDAFSQSEVCQSQSELEAHSFKQNPLSCMLHRMWLCEAIARALHTSADQLQGVGGQGQDAARWWKRCGGFLPAPPTIERPCPPRMYLRTKCRASGAAATASDQYMQWSGP